MSMPFFRYEPESLEAAKKYLNKEEIYDINLKKDVNALWFMEQKKLQKTIEWHAMIEMANKLKGQEAAK